MSLIIIGLILFYTFISAYIDYEHRKDNDFIESHVSRVAQRAAVGFLILFACGYQMAFVYLFSFIALFDSIQNLLMDDKVFHLGSTAKWDVFFTKNKYLYILVKIISFLALVFSIFTVLNN